MLLVTVFTVHFPIISFFFSLCRGWNKFLHRWTMFTTHLAVRWDFIFFFSCSAAHLNKLPVSPPEVVHIYSIQMRVKDINEFVFNIKNPTSIWRSLLATMHSMWQVAPHWNEHSFNRYIELLPSIQFFFHFVFSLSPFLIAQQHVSDRFLIWWNCFAHDYRIEQQLLNFDTLCGGIGIGMASSKSTFLALWSD